MGTSEAVPDPGRPAPSPSVPVWVRGAPTTWLCSHKRSEQPLPLQAGSSDLTSRPPLVSASMATSDDATQSSTLHTPGVYQPMSLRRSRPLSEAVSSSIKWGYRCTPPNSERDEDKGTS